MSQKLVDARLVGVISKPHGIKGEVNVMLLTDYPNTILKGSVLYYDKNCTEKILVENMFLKRSGGRESAVIKFKDILTRNDAVALRGKELYRKAGDSPVLNEGEFWIDDIEGCRVYFKDNTELGIVEKVEILPANENLVIKPVNGKSIIYIPLVDDYIDSIDIRDKRIVVKKIPEYL